MQSRCERAVTTKGDGKTSGKGESKRWVEEEDVDGIGLKDLGGSEDADSSKDWESDKEGEISVVEETPIEGDGSEEIEQRVRRW